MAVRQVLQCSHFNTWENFIFLSGLALDMGYQISPTLLQNKGMFIHLSDCFIHPTQYLHILQCTTGAHS